MSNPRFEALPFPGDSRKDYSSPDAMHKEVYDPVATTYEGRPCKVQPRANQIPQLDAGKGVGDGCQVKTYKPSEHPTKDGALDIPDLYKKAKEQNVQIKIDDVSKRGEPGASVGSGVIVGRKGDEILVMTDNHVLKKEPGYKRIDLQARFGDGHVYNGHVLARDKKNDTAIVSFKTGADTDREFHPATVQDGWSELKKDHNYLITGFPRYTSKLHVSPGKELTLDRLGGPRGSDSIDPNRFQALMRANTLEGYSGGAAYNSKGILVGTLEGGQPGDTRHSVVNPISRQYVARLLKQAGVDP